MSIVLDGTTGITTPALDSAAKFASADMPLGSVLQVVYGSTSTQVANTTTTYTDTGLTATITPTSATSKILVIVTQSCYKTPSPTSAVNIKLFRGATDLGQFIKDECYTGTTLANVSTAAFQELETPEPPPPPVFAVPLTPEALPPPPVPPAPCVLPAMPEPPPPPA